MIKYNIIGINIDANDALQVWLNTDDFSFYPFSSVDSLKKNFTFSIHSVIIDNQNLKNERLFGICEYFKKMNCPIIVILRNKDNQLVNDLIQANVEKILYKPITAIEVKSMLSDLLSKNKFIQIEHKLLEAFKKTVVIFDDQLNIIFVNSIYEELTGYDQAELLGKNLSELSSKYHSFLFFDNMVETITKNLTWQGEIQSKTKNNDIIWERVLIKPIEASNQIEFYARISEDITSLKRKSRNTDLEREMAFEVQQKLLPEPFENEKFKVSGKYYPLEKISGDIYFWSPINKNHVFIMLADVVGHGISSALLTTSIVSLVNNALANNKELSAFLYDLNNTVINMFNNNTFDSISYFTGIFIDMDLKEYTMTYYNCGHPEMISIGGYNQKRKNKNYPIGLFENITFTPSELEVSKGEKILLFTDGLIDLQLEYINVKQLLTETLKKGDASSMHILDYLEFELLEHYYDQIKDDISIVLMELK